MATRFKPVLLALMLTICPFFTQFTAAQGGSYSADPAWADIPGGAWDGSTSWVAADGKGQILVMVRSAPYFRLFNRDGQFIRSWGEDGLYRNAHSVTFDAQGNVWATDAARQIVQKYSIDGELLMTLGSLDEAGDNASLRCSLLSGSSSYTRLSATGRGGRADGCSNAA
jgi:hypothetical protein